MRKDNLPVDSERKMKKRTSERFPFAQRKEKL